jgi:amidase
VRHKSIDYHKLTPEAYQFKHCFNDFLETFENTPQTIAELIEFNKRHADKEITDCKYWFNTRNRDCNSNNRSRHSRREPMVPGGFATTRGIRRKCNSGTKRFAHRQHRLCLRSPVGNLPLGFADFNGREFSLHMVAPENPEAKML